MPPNQQAGNPYGFITNPGTPQRTGRGSVPMKSRIIVAVVGIVVLVIVAVVFVSILGSSGKGLAKDYQSLLQQQTELVRVSAIGTDRAGQADAKNLAITTSLSITGQQKALLSTAKKAGAKTDVKTLALGKSVETDSRLNKAAELNQFDETFIKVMQQQLTEYQQTLKKIYDQTTKKTTKDILGQDFADVKILIGNPETTQ